MNNSRRILLACILLILVIKLDAQLLLTDHQAHKVVENKVLLRWEPNSGEEWLSSQSTGFTINKYRISSTGIEESIGSEIIKPAAVEDWLQYENSASDYNYDFAVGARTIIYPDTDEKKNQFDKIFDLKGDKNRANRLSLGFLMYSISYDFEIAKLAGLAYEMPVDEKYTYRFEIKSAGNSPIIINVDPSQYKEASIPQILPEWSNKEVNLKWDAAKLQGAYLGYMISKSEDGVTYQKVNNKPRTNSLGLISDTSALLQIAYRDTLEVNDKTYWYKIEGFDYFGAVSNSNKIVSGQGYEGIRISPIIEYASQTEDNHAHIKWYMPEAMAKLVKTYRITRANNDSGQYITIADSISNTEREYMIPLEKTENHFRVEAVPFRGKPVGSISVFIMGQDTIAPLVPEVIGAYIDSVGNIEVKWKSNTEDDLWGYRIFKSNFDEQEYGLLNSVITKDTIFRDTVDINFNTKHVFYKLYATDTRDNKSAFTLPIKVEKPDIFPPGMANLGKMEQRGDTLYISWHPSGSDDVVNHKIFRRAINLENSWTLVGILDSTDIGEPFLQLDLDYNVPYAYTIIAYDDADLKSKAIMPKRFTLKKIEPKFEPFKSVNYSYNDETKEVTIAWDLNDISRLKNVLIYRGYSDNRMGKYKLLDSSSKMLTETVLDKDKVFYKVKPIYEEQKQDYFSELIEINLKGADD